jgi:hypothetical protein
MGKRIAYYALHYGKEYLAWSMRSVQDSIDEFHMLYSAKPSFGYNPHTPGITCPDTREELVRESERFLKKPIFWHEQDWKNEAMHRDYVYKVAKDHNADIIFVVDADEVWHPLEAAQALKIVSQRPEHYTRVRSRSLWRSFNWFVEEGAMPIRFLRPEGKGEFYLGPQEYPIYHFNYAQSERTSKYRMEVHSHKAEMNRDWFETVYKRWTPQAPFDDVHPCKGNHQYNPRPIEPKDKEVVKLLMWDHPYMGLDLIR